MSDKTGEEWLSLSKAARSVPPRGVHVSTLFRWGQKGCRGVRLEIRRIAGRWYTKPDFLESFLAKICQESRPDGLVPRTPHERSRSVQHAQDSLRRAGF